MKRGFVVAIGGVAIVVAGLTGCSDNKSSTATQTAASGTGKAKVTIDDKDQNVQGDIVCANVGDNYSISIGNTSQGGASTVVSQGDSPEVQQVGLVLDGQPLAYNKGTPGGGDAKAAKDGKKYTITGNLVGMPDMSNPMAGPSTHKFSMEVTCP